MPTAAEIVARTDRLATLPIVYLRVKEVIDDPHGTVPQLVAAMATDAAMTARVLRIVNSAFYGFSVRIETVTRAVNILGTQQVHDMVLAWAISTNFADMHTAVIPMHEYWRGSVTRGIVARQLASEAHFVDAERLFIEGLLSDIGHLVMYTTVPDLALQARQESKHSGRPLDQVEREIIGCDYAQVGAALVAAWELPAVFAEPIECQITPATASMYHTETAMLHVAGVVATHTLDNAAAHIDSGARFQLKLNESAIGALYAKVSMELESVVATFFPHLRAA